MGNVMYRKQLLVVKKVYLKSRSTIFLDHD